MAPDDPPAPPAPGAPEAQVDNDLTPVERPVPVPGPRSRVVEELLLISQHAAEIDGLARALAKQLETGRAEWTQRAAQSFDESVRIAVRRIMTRLENVPRE